MANVVQNYKTDCFICRCVKFYAYSLLYVCFSASKRFYVRIFNEDKLTLGFLTILKLVFFKLKRTNQFRPATSG